MTGEEKNLRGERLEKKKNEQEKNCKRIRKTMRKAGKRCKGKRIMQEKER